MATPSQLVANLANSQKSTGPVTTEGKQASSKNRTTHGLCYHNASFFLTDDESEEHYQALLAKLRAEHQPQTETEKIIVRRMTQHEWLRARALRFQHCCLFEDQHIPAKEHFALYVRYETTHERGFFKCLNELQKLRAERRNARIGFESHKLKQAAEERASQAQELKKQALEMQEEVHQMKKERHQVAVARSNGRPSREKAAETSAATLKNAA